jgi:hypothetical protein
MTKTNLIINKIGLIIQSNNTADAANTIADIMVDVVVLARNVQAGNPQLEIKTDPVSKLTIDIIEQSIDKKFFS